MFSAWLAYIKKLSSIITPFTSRLLHFTTLHVSLPCTVRKKARECTVLCVCMCVFISNLVLDIMGLWSYAIMVPSNGDGGGTARDARTHASTRAHAHVCIDFFFLQNAGELAPENIGSILSLALPPPSLPPPKHSEKLGADPATFHANQEGKTREKTVILPACCSPPRARTTWRWQP